MHVYSVTASALQLAFVPPIEPWSGSWRVISYYLPITYLSVNSTCDFVKNRLPVLVIIKIPSNNS